MQKSGSNMEEKAVGIVSLAASQAAGAGSAGLPPFQSAATIPSRERFYVELKPNETTVVSWKKLLKEAQKTTISSASEAPAGAHPALEARIAPEAGPVSLHNDRVPPPPNRFNSVIEKIERLYKGVHSSEVDENLSDVPDDDKYDTSDSFIDDEELDEYFSVDQATPKHTGFFVNKGKLEGLNEPILLPDFGPKKRKRKDSKKSNNEIIFEDLNKSLLKSGVRLKAAARKVSLSTTAASDPTSEKTKSILAAKPALIKQSNKSDSLKGEEPKDEPRGIEACKTREDSTCQNGKDFIEISKDLASERLRDVSTMAAAPVADVERCDVSDEQKTDLVLQCKGQSKDISREALVVGLKTTHKQKGSVDDDARERGIAKPSIHSAKDASPGRLKGTILERAIQDLERGVTDLCPPSFNTGELEQAFEPGGKSRRLPRDVKQKLAKVARLAAKQGRITDDLIERLMGILGHVMRVKTLKRNLKAMIEMGLSARQEKEGRLQDIKCEVTEMVKSRVSTLLVQEAEQQDVSSDDFQAEPGTGDRGSMSSRYAWDQATEDRISDLYDQYIEGMDEHRGPQIRKLYAELAELWPEGWMDNIGIKYAIHRSKERKKKLTKFAMDESRRKQKASGTFIIDEAGAERNLPPVAGPPQSPNLLDRAGYDDHPAQGSSVHDAHKQHEDTRKYSRKLSGKTVSSVEKKRKKLECPPLKTKMRKKSEKDTIDWQLVSQRDVQHIQLK